MPTVTFDSICRAAELIKGQIIETPCVPSYTLSQITGCEVILKFEIFQFTASFKERGALVKLLSLSAEERKQGVAAMSAGNHGLAVAYHARRLGIPAVIVMPRNTPNIKVEQAASFGAEVILEGPGVDEAGVLAKKLAQERGLCFIHPYDDEKVIAGQGTIALEMLRAFPDLEVLIAPVGGGGLLAGLAIAAKTLRPSIELVGVQSVRCPSMAQALKSFSVECHPPTIAEGIAVRQPGRLTLPIIRGLVNEIILVDEPELEQAVLLLLEVEKAVAEGAGAAGLAPLLQKNQRFRGKKVGIVLSGGNIDLLILSSIIQRGLVRSGRLVRLLIAIRDFPGALSEVTRLLGEWGANIIEVHHQRTFTALPLQTTEVEFVLQTRGISHWKEILRELYRANYSVRLMDKDPDKAETKSTIKSHSF
ncbi:MAG TPA: threonine ammonia-lyase [Thermodesulfobacteriota bacterium]|nr:threonine ammonia-lyase [Thermodesulfobacteriota bacterium]